MEQVETKTEVVAEKKGKRPHATFTTQKPLLPLKDYAPYLKKKSPQYIAYKAYLHTKLYESPASEYVSRIIGDFKKGLITPEFVLAGLFRELNETGIQIKEKIKIYDLLGRYLKLWESSRADAENEFFHFNINFNLHKEPKPMEEVVATNIIDVPKKKNANKNKQK